MTDGKQTKPTRLRLTLVVQADLVDGQIENAQAHLNFSAKARYKAVGDQLIRLAEWSLEKYRENGWAGWEDVGREE